MRELSVRQRLRLPRRRGDRALLACGAAALLVLIPLAWIWVLYASRLGPDIVALAAVALSAAAAVIGFAMIRALDRR